MKINDYMTPNEAAYRWDKNQETLKNKLKPSVNGEQIKEMEEQGLIKSFIRPGGKRKDWIISTQAMEKWFPKKE